MLETVSDYIALTNRSPPFPGTGRGCWAGAGTGDTAIYGEKLAAGQPHPDHWMRYREKHIQAPAVACQTTGGRSERLLGEHPSGLTMPRLREGARLADE